MIPQLSTAPLTSTRYAPLLMLGWWMTHHDLWSPIRSRVRFTTPTHTSAPVDALLDLVVGLLAGCEVVAQVNTTIRSEPLLAQAWGRTQFAEQSTIARTLDAATAVQVAQWRAANEVMLHWTGQVGQHDFARQHLRLDVDLTGLAASSAAEGSQKGYFAGKKTPPDGNWRVSRLRPPGKPSFRCCFPGAPAVRHQ